MPEARAHTQCVRVLAKNPTPQMDRAVGESACKPGSVVDNHSSGPRVASWLKQPTRKRRGQRHGFPIWSCSGWGLPCRPCYHVRGALLPHHFTLTDKLPAVYFLLHWPWARAPQTLSGTLPCGARTFLQFPQEPAIIRLTRGHFKPLRRSVPAPATDRLFTARATVFAAVITQLPEQRKLFVIEQEWPNRVQ